MEHLLTGLLVLPVYARDYALKSSFCQLCALCVGSRTLPLHARVDELRRIALDWLIAAPDVGPCIPHHFHGAAADFSELLYVIGNEAVLPLRVQQFAVQSTFQR